MFAIIEIGGKQYKVSKGLKFWVEKLDLKDNEDKVIDKILLLSNENETKIGRPYIEGSEVKIKKISDKKDDKVMTIKMKSKKRYIRKIGHRQNYSLVEVMEIK